jgi:hypothetical protein
LSHLSEFFRQRRLETGLTLCQAARHLAYKNLSRGCNRIQVFELGGKVHSKLLSNLAEMLEITPEDIRQRVSEDHQDWLAWADEPVRPHLVIRYLAAVYKTIALPDDALDPDAAEASEAQLAMQRKFQVCSVLIPADFGLVRREGKKLRTNGGHTEDPVSASRGARREAGPF